MEFEFVSCFQMNVILLSAIIFLSSMIIVLCAIILKNRGELKSAKLNMLSETKHLLREAVKLATHNVVNSFKMDDSNFEFERGKLLSDLEKNMSKMFREDSGRIFSKLYDIRDLYCKHREIPADFFQKEIEEIISFYTKAATLVECIELNKGIKELFVECPKEREQLLLKIEKFSKKSKKSE